MIQGGKDQVVKNRGSDLFYEKIKVNKQKIIYEDQDHMIFHDRD